MKYYITCLCILLLASCRNVFKHEEPAALMCYAEVKHHELNDDPLIFEDGREGQTGFVSVVADTLTARIFPNAGRRQQLNMHTVPGVVAVTHFFLDFDLTSGYVHAYTKNFYNKLRPDDFVMKFDRFSADPDLGYVSYKRKKDLKKEDRLGYNVAFFRQWKLSEIEFKMDSAGKMVYVKPCSFMEKCDCPQVKADNDNPYKGDVPVWSMHKGNGWMKLSEYDKLGLRDGGTVVIIWQLPNGKVLFQDVHGSLNRILSRAVTIAQEYRVDPVIAISDAGPMANKFVADKIVGSPGTELEFAL